MNESLFDKLVEISWRRRLTPEEEGQLQAWLAAHPADAERWELETSLNGALDRLEPVVPPSNFTSQVLQLVERDQRASERAQAESPRRWWMIPRLRLGWSLATAVIILVGYQQIHQNSRRMVTRGVQSFSAALASPEVLEDFETIQKFSQFRPELDETDEALFVLLSK
jgi:hypothetical protein